MKIITIIISLLSFILSQDTSILQISQTCSECDVVWWDDYWGTQCCDSAWDQWGFDCLYMESEYGWDCTGCNCPYDNNPICGDGFCNGSENIESCSSDCTINGCNTENQVDDCADGDCCPESWIGDGYGDCEDPYNFGCDLSCYDNDGGDCPTDIIGDLNDDEIIDILDIIIEIDIILGILVPSEFELIIGDINLDGVIDIYDIILIINIIIV